VKLLGIIGKSLQSSRRNVEKNRKIGRITQISLLTYDRKHQNNGVEVRRATGPKYRE